MSKSEPGDYLHPGTLALALLMASRGFRVFPCLPNAKEPAQGFLWKAKATTDKAVIARWFADAPDMNYAIAFDPGQFALDLDTKGGKDGIADLSTLEALHDTLPVTFTVETPSGGRHLYQAGQAANSVGKVAPGIDVRAPEATS